MASGSGFERSRRAGARAGLRGLAYALLLGEVLVILIPSVYGRATPKLFGIPFFYWFQLAWIIVGMVVTGIAYLLIERAGPASMAGRSGPPGMPPSQDGPGGGR